MTKPRIIDRIWRDLFAGDSFYTKRPYSELVATAENLAGEGYEYVFEEANGGYCVFCMKSPLTTIQDGYDRLNGTVRP